MARVARAATAVAVAAGVERHITKTANLKSGQAVVALRDPGVPEVTERMAASLFIIRRYHGRAEICK